jgi:hypothetical protein
MLSDLQTLQTSTAELSVSFQNTAASTAQSHISPHVKRAFADFSHKLSATVAEFSSTHTAKDLDLQEKARTITADICERIMPLLGSFAEALSDMLPPRVVTRALRARTSLAVLVLPPKLSLSLSLSLSSR